MPPVGDEAQPQLGDSTLKVRAVEGWLTFPATSVAVVVSACWPCASRSELTVHTPSGSAIAVPTTIPSTSTVTVLRGSATPPKSSSPGCAVAPSAGVTTSGGIGAMLSTTKEIGSDSGLEFPDERRAVARAE